MENIYLDKNDEKPNMNNFRNVIFYIGVIGGFSLLMYWVVQQGELLEANKVINPVTFKDISTWQQFKEGLLHNLSHPLAILLVQIVTIIITARVFGYLFRKIGQPTVIGEIIAGIFLGPSVVGWLFPDLSASLFPLESLGNLQFLSQIGLILFMFVIGMELDLNVLKNKAHDAIVISHASIIIPFALGMWLAYSIYEIYAPANIGFLSFGLFMGIGMSITAFPVLARIVQERGMSKTRLGTVAITCAAADDITAWCLLAAVIAIVKAGSFLSALYTIALAGIYVIVMLKIVMPFLKRLGSIHSNKETLSKPIVGIFFLVLLLSSYASEVIGIHALFGAFMAGVIMPENIRFRNLFIEKVEDVAVVLLLPLFFVFTGLRTQIGLLNEGHLWVICGLIILVAVAGKLIGSAIAARFVGQTWRESLIIGSLMNTRGLMELVVLNIGYDLGVLTPEVFAMMVIMALITTFMTGPALDLINKISPEKIKPDRLPKTVLKSSKYKILISFGNPESGRTMLRLANGFIRKNHDNADVTALHVSHSNEINIFNQDEVEKESFAPIYDEALSSNAPVSTLFKPAQDINKEIIEVANEGDYDLMLIGIGHSIFKGTFLGKILGFSSRIINPEKLIDTISGKDKLFDEIGFDERVRDIAKNTHIPLGVLIDKNLQKTDNVFVPVFSEEDSFLLSFAQKLIKNNDSRIMIIDTNGFLNESISFKENIRAIEQVAPYHIAIINEKTIKKEFLEEQDLMLVSLSSWQKLVNSQSLWLSNIPSALVIKPAESGKS